MELITDLAKRVAKLSSENGIFQTPLAKLTTYRASVPSNCEANIYKPSLLLTLQGSKRLNLATEQLDFSAGKSLLSSVDIPITSGIMQASVEAPYLSIIYELDPNSIGELISELGLHRPSVLPESQGLTITPASEPIVEVLWRMIRLLDTPEDIALIYPLLEKELNYRLLTSEQGGSRLRHLCSFDSSTHKVARAVKYLQENYLHSVRIESLASEVSMSVSSLHQHFKSITTLTPLQYQKQLRLHAARKMIIQNAEIALTAYKVGYESASQFSRDYSRLFGVAPSKESKLV